MDTEGSPRTQAIAQAASECPPCDRASLLESACGGDAALREEVERLLRARANPEKPLEKRPTLVDAAADLRTAETDLTPLPPHIGPYRVQRELGQGGIGTVYLAERDDADFRQMVAIKVMRE